MKKTTLYIIIILSIGAMQQLLSQGNILESENGRINNLGTIKVKNGQVRLGQDTILGRVEFLQKYELSQQSIPNMVYNQLVLKNTAKKIVRDDNKDVNNNTLPIVVMDSLIIEDTANFTTRWIGSNPEDIQAKGAVKNNANYDGPKYIIMDNQNQKQNLMGNGIFSKLSISNPLGVDIITGGFTITSDLLLKEGELRNSNINNFVMADSSLITRYPQSSLITEPKFDGIVSVHYKGNGDITAGQEIPSNRKTLKTLKVENKGVLTLSKNTVVNDSLVFASNIITNKDTLELNNRNNLFFDTTNHSLEIVGNFKRNIIIPGDSILLNNQYTWIRFNSINDLGEVKAITSTILPSKFQPYIGGSDKVKRVINLNAYSNNGLEIVGKRFRAQFGYSWRHNNDSTNNETNGLNLAELVLQRWTGDSWSDLPSSKPSTNFYGWAFAITDTFDSSGAYAIGLADIYSNLVFRAYTLLEGPYIPGSKDKMTLELWKRNILSQVSTDEYPLNLIADIKNQIPVNVPDSVVDYAVLEFRRERNGETVYNLPIFIKFDGRLVDMFGRDRIRLKDTLQNNKFGGDYYVILRHRNHAPVVTEKPLHLAPENNTLVYNFNDPSFIEGGSTSLKLVDYVDNKLIYAMKGGFIPYDKSDIDALINVTLHYTNPVYWEDSWKQFTNIGYIRSDFNLSGIVTTKDFNISWNNRGK